MLHAPHIAALQVQGHRLHGLALQVGQQPLEVEGGVAALLFPAKEGVEAFDVDIQGLPRTQRVRPVQAAVPGAQPEGRRRRHGGARLQHLHLRPSVRRMIWSDYTKNGILSLCQEVSL